MFRSTHRQRAFITNKSEPSTGWAFAEMLEPRLLLSHTLGFQERLETPSAPQSIIACDLNGDGVQDMVVTDRPSDTLSIFLGTGDGAFVSGTNVSTGLRPYSVIAADLNGDGISDLVATNSLDNTVSVLLGYGDGTFQPKNDFDTGTTPESVIAADFNSDGNLDLAVANAAAGKQGAIGGVSILLGNGDGSFQPQSDIATGLKPTCVVAADFNADGNLDLATANPHDNTVSILLGQGDGTFGDYRDFSTGSTPQSLVVADLNNDGVPDLATANFDSGNVSVLLGNGKGAFGDKTDFAADSWASSLVTGDFNGDGNADLATANYESDTVSILLGTGDGALQAKQDYSTDMNTGPVSLVAADLDGNGTLDLATANQIGFTVSVLRGLGDGTFQLTPPQTDFPANSYSTWVAAADFNGDGVQDIVTSSGGWPLPTTSLSLYLGNSDGTFKPKSDFHVGSEQRVDSIVAGDFNGDGKMDIIASNYSSGTLSVYLGKGNGTFQGERTISVGGGPLKITAADLNGDGALDLVIVGDNGGISLWKMLGNGNGTFDPPAYIGDCSNTRSVIAPDLNGDGIADLVTADCGQNTVSVWLGSFGGIYNFKGAFSANSSAFTVCAADVDGDGVMDLVTANGENSGALSVLLGDDDGTFQPAVTYAVRPYPSQVLAADINRDGNVDLVSGSGSVLLGSGDGTFVPGYDFNNGTNPSPLLAIDLNGDGLLDLVGVNDTELRVALNGTSNTAPQAADDTLDVTVGETLLAVGVDVLANDSDADGDTLSVTAVGDADIGTVSLSNGIIQYAPRAGYSGDDSFTYTVSDGFGGTATATVHVTVDQAFPPDEAPVNTVPQAQTVNEDANLVFSSANGNAITVADADDNGGIEKVTLTATHGILTLGKTTGLASVSGNGTSKVTFTGTIANLNAAMNGLVFRGAQDYNGSASLQIETNDQAGSGGGPLSDTDSVAITVNAVNDPPAFTKGSNVAVYENCGHQSINWATAISPGPANESTQTVSFLIQSDTNAALFSVAPAISSSGVLTFTPATGARGTATITVAARDNGGTANGGVNTSASQTFTIQVNNHAPVLTPITLTMPTINQDATSNAGVKVSSLIASATITDPDTNAVKGIAVTDTNIANGSWQYSLNSGATWTTFKGYTTAARLLAANASTYIRFVPSAGFFGTVTGGITFRAWDQTSGANGGTINTLTTGGASSISSAKASANIVVQHANHAPLLDSAGDMKLTKVVVGKTNPGTKVSALIASAGGNRITDADSADKEGIAVVATDTTHGTWQYSLDGKTWLSLTGSNTSARLLSADAYVRFTPAKGYTGTVTKGLTFHAWDQTSGSNGGTLSTTTNGGNTSISVAVETASVIVSLT